VRIESAELARYVGPGRSLIRPHGLVVRLHAEPTGTAGGRGRLTGTGEAVVAGDQTGPAWQELAELAAGVVGASLPPQLDPARPLDKLPDWRPAGPLDRGARRSAKLAIEMALLDLLHRTGALPWPYATVDQRAGEAGPTAGPGGAGRSSGAGGAVTQPVHQLPRAAPGTAAEALTAQLRADSGAAWAVRLRLTGDDRLDLDWVREAVAIERRAGRNRPLWLVGGSRQPAVAAGFVRELAGLVAGSDGPGQVLLEEPIARDVSATVQKLWERSTMMMRLPARSPLVRLQRIADRRGAAGRLLVTAGDSVASAAQAAALAGTIGALHLSVTRFSSLVGLRQAARAAKRANPAVVVLLAGARGSRITSQALAALAAATPEIDHYVPEPPVGSWPVLAFAAPAESPAPAARAAPAAPTAPAESPAPAAPAARAAPPATGPGLVTGVDLAELASVADELASVPPAPPAAGEPPNRFPDYPLAGAAMAVRSMLLETEALRLGLPTRRLARDFFLAEYRDPGSGGGGIIGFADSEASTASLAAAVATADKAATRALLERAGLPVPPGAAVPAGEIERARQAGLALGFPLAVKPAGGSKGTAVTVGIRTAEELAAALAEVTGSRYADTGFIVERSVAGNDYRVLATRTDVLSVIRREPASVVGDGRRTVEELVLAANVARRHNPHLAKRLITLDDRADDQLARQELDRWSVPAAGVRVRLRAEANLSLGGDSREVRDSAHPSLRELATAVVAAIPGLPYAGLDILMADHRQPVADQPVHIIEVNSRPVQSMHHFPMYGPPRNVSARLVADAVAAAGWPARPPAEQLTVRMAVTGRVRGVGYRRWLAGLARQLDLAGWLAGGDGGSVTGLVHGRAARVGLLLRLAFHGPAGASVMERYAAPVEVVPPAGFSVRGTAKGR
jgi:D-alanine-D-alanine ligase-like ATP-grasp enzyme/acylphosphatase